MSRSGTRSPLATAVALLLCLAAELGAQEPPQTYNTKLYGHTNPAPPKGGERYSALWGYTAPDNREYALLGGANGTHVIDINDTNLREVALIPGPSSGWREMKTYRTWGYVVSEGGGGLQIIDLSQLPASATLVRSDTSLFTTAHTVSREGHFLYVHGTRPEAGANGGTLIFDLEPDPTSPRLVGKYSERYVHDAVIVNDTMYAAAINNGQLDIVALGADRTNPHRVASIFYPGAGTHNSDLTIDHRYVMTTDEVGTTPKTLKVWDLADLEDIRKVVDYTPVPGEIIHNVHTKGTLAVVAWYTAGTRIIDMSNPLAPAELGWFDTSPERSATYNGNWETYPYFTSGKIIASDMQSGLWVFTFASSGRGRVQITVRDSATGAPIPGATVVIAELGKTFVTDDFGRVDYLGAIDTFDVAARALLYRPKLQQVVVAPAAGTEPGSQVDILLPAVELAQLRVGAVDAVTRAPLPSFAWSEAEHNLGGTAADGVALLQVPRDSTIQLLVGAWGYHTVRAAAVNRGDSVTVALPRGYVDPMELDLGWSGSIPSDNAVTGRWERGLPIATTQGISDTAQPGVQTTPGGRYAWFTGLAGSEESAGANDVDDGATSLTSPAFPTAPYNSSDPYLNVFVWYSANLNPTAIDDTLLLQLENGDGSWSTFLRRARTTSGWNLVNYRLGDLSSLGATTRLRVVASDRGGPSLVEAAVDDFYITDGPSIVPIPFDSVDAIAGVGSRTFASNGVRARVVPNPAPDRATIELLLDAPLQGGRLLLLDARGAAVLDRALETLPAGPSTLPLDLSALPAGVYHWQITGTGASAGGTVRRVR